MKILALLLGLAAGLYGLFVSLIGGALITMLAAAGLDPTVVIIAKVLVYGLPLLSLVGAFMVFRKPMVATVLLGLSGLVWLALSFSITATPESSVDPKQLVIPLAVINLVGALFAWLAARKAAAPKLA
jgi:hypothetical protein